MSNSPISFGRRIARRAAGIVAGISPAAHAKLVSHFGRHDRIAKLISAATSGRVAHGPFAGMRYGDVGHGSTYLPKLVGSYEEELHAIVRELTTQPFGHVVNIGCGEGYYAVGIARAMPTVVVNAFDLSTQAQEACWQMAQANGVGQRVVVHGGCNVDTLGRCLRGNDWVVCDCEGYEVTLLDPASVPELKNSTILAEMHDCFVPGASDLLRERFRATHAIRIIEMTGRDASRYSVLNPLHRADRARAMDEGRVHNGAPLRQTWMLLTPR
jgi:predicted O-methyltransferase YrrM